MANNDGKSRTKTPPKDETDLTDMINLIDISAEEVPCGFPKPSSSSLKASSFGNSKKMKTEINIEFPDVITTATSSELVTELIKYLLYLKEQIPYDYSQLRNFVERKKKWDLEKENVPDRPSVARSTAILAEKHYSKCSQAVETLELIFQSLRAEMGEVREVALLLGATVASPQEAYLLQLPPLIPAPSDAPPSRSCLTHLIRELISSESLHEVTSRPSRPTNVYILLRKPASGDSWFEPRPAFSVPSRCRQVSLRFCQPSGSFKVFEDAPLQPPREAAPEERDPGQWFQAPRLLRGFKDCYVGGQCATDLWLKL